MTSKQAIETPGRTLRRCKSRNFTMLFFAVFLILLTFEATAFVVPSRRRLAHTECCILVNQKQQRQYQQQRQQTLLLLLLFQSPKDLDIELREMEREVVGSTKAKLDLKRLSNAIESELESTGNPDLVANDAAPWQLATAAAITASVATFFITNNNSFLSTVVFIGAFFAALGDPIEEEGLAGSLARLLGRQTIESVERSKPKIRAVVRAIADEETIVALEEEVKELREENARLQLWKKRRTAIDEVMPYFSLEELKDMARRHKLPVSGTKTQLVSRLVENNVIDVDYS
jgi:hypothetical protein